MPLSPASRWRFQRRTMFWAVLVTAISICWYGYRIHNDRVQRQLIDSIGKKGGFVWLDVVGPFIDVQFTPSPSGRGCGQVHCLTGPIGASGMLSDNDLPLFDRLDHLRSINFANTNVSEHAIVEFQRRHPKCLVTTSP